MKNIKSNKGITNATVLIIVLIIIVLMLLATVIYLVKNPNTTYITQNIPTEQQEVNLSNVEEEKLTATTEIKTEKVEMTSDEKYKAYLDGLKNSLNNFSQFGECFDENLVLPDVPTQYTAFDNLYGVEGINLKTNGEVYLKLTPENDLYKKYGEDYKIGTNIIKAGAMYCGHDASVLLYMISSIGKFYYCELIDLSRNTTEDTYKFKETAKLKNIVSVEQHKNSYMIFAIDIDGKMYDVMNTIQDV